MKINVLLAAIVWIAVGTVMNAQITTVTIARKNNNCGLRTDIGYSIVTNGSEAQQRKSAQENLFQKYPELDSFEVIHSEKKHFTYQNILVIITTNTISDHCETQKTFGVGFGYTQENALKNALTWVNMLNPHWNKEKDGYQITLIKDFSLPSPSEEISMISEE